MAIHDLVNILGWQMMKLKRLEPTISVSISLGLLLQWLWRLICRRWIRMRLVLTLGALLSVQNLGPTNPQIWRVLKIQV